MGQPYAFQKYSMWEGCDIHSYVNYILWFQFMFVSLAWFKRIDVGSMRLTTKADNLLVFLYVYIIISGKLCS